MTLRSAKRAGTAAARGAINLRVAPDVRTLIDTAAAATGKTRTEFMIESARQHAIDVLLDQRLFVFDSARYDAFVQVLDHPPLAGPKLKGLMRRTPAWAT